MPQSFSHSLACELRDYPEWHKGRSRYGVWVLQVDNQAVLARIQEARQLLGDWLHPPGARQAHITLFVCGFSAAQAEHDDDFTDEQLAAQLNALQALSPPRFSLQIGPARSFSSAAYLEVLDAHQQLAPLRQALAGSCQEIRQSNYVPHLTLGLYRQRIRRELIEQRLAQLPSQPLELPVNQLHYATYDAREQHGGLHYQHSWTLAN
ncbi:2'-5' RNA ligase family protein [Pseudomonas sp. 5P_3.1_Bac2]|uniref:2'-5' RNA ligase family protein n=1 Tax=Pseudomonas sp. 5P_3.1_Bac2 TaxID=2971617 RepID=UPI0021C75CE6|nr:2'-5' RNA ligase family protein [Pseudomonas sp. 5P_3.1_Bac2]MCU1719622.1 2'-5' RNA ligase family protein [Pseudomonas sp. 5P_3.1_Bac2]